jgi:beta-phosphoglucomutase
MEYQWRGECLESYFTGNGGNAGRINAAVNPSFFLPLSLSLMHMQEYFNQIKGFIFDLDGVIVDTRPYHLMAWQHVAEDFGVRIDEGHNEVLRGLSRMKSLEKILEWGNLYLTEAEKLYWSDLKNNKYLELIAQMTPDEVLPGVRVFLEAAKEDGYKTALVSSSKNARSVLRSVRLESFFDAVIDGNVTKKSKPAPDCFLLAADALDLNPSECVVFEDAPNGVMAAKQCNFMTVAVGMHSHICFADTDIKGFDGLTICQLKKALPVGIEEPLNTSISIN